MNVRVLGCHGGTSRSHQSVSFLLEGRLAVDAGSLASGLMLEEQACIEAILVTHSHLDHVNDLGSICDIRTQQAGRPLLIAGLPETIDALRQHFFNDILWPDFTAIEIDGGPVVEFLDLEPEVEVEVAGFRVRPVPVNHTVPSCGFLLTNGTGTLVYTGDTGPTERIWTLVNETPGVRAVITEISFPNRMADLARITGHLTPATFAGEVQKLEQLPEHGVIVYGMKPVFTEEITREVAELDLAGCRLLEGPVALELG